MPVSLNLPISNMMIMACIELATHYHTAIKLQNKKWPRKLTTGETQILIFWTIFAINDKVGNSNQF